ncbi:MAG: type IV pilus twitching motility protein PilT [bacterium]
MPLEITDLLRLTIERDASDLHLAVGRPPVLRIDGKLINVEAPPLTAAEARRLVYSMLTDLQKQKFEDNKELDFSLSVASLSRFRVNAHLQRGTVAAAFRTIAATIRNFEELHLPTDILTYLSRRPAGFVLVTGPTGSGKSTTLAAIIDLINRENEVHIITVEDPIEYLHTHKKALVEQREVNEDTFSFANALKYVLRQDPDVIMVGEMRDLETISAALTAAETGHLVFSTLHTVDVVQTVDRIIDVFPPHQQEQVRIQLAGVLEGAMSQKLIPSLFRGREIALELMIASDAIRNLIREGHTHQIFSMIEAGGAKGMQTMDRALVDLCRKGKISREIALLNARKPDEIKRYLV